MSLYDLEDEWSSSLLLSSVFGFFNKRNQEPIYLYKLLHHEEPIWFRRLRHR
jgi:hypothetical protein